MGEEASVEDKYPRVTAAQLEMWEAHPVTKAFMLCLDLRHKELEDTPIERLTDSASADLTLSMVHSHMGSKAENRESRNYAALFHRAEMIEIPKIVVDGEKEPEDA